MDETIYIPRHRLDLEEMVALSVKKGFKRLFVLSFLYGYSVACTLYELFFRDSPTGVPMAALIGLGVALLFGIMTTSNYRKVYARPGQRLLFEDRTIVLEPAGIKVDYANGATSSFPWSIILREEWQRDLLLLYIADATYIIIPRRLLTVPIEDAVKAALQRVREARGIAAPPRMI